MNRSTVEKQIERAMGELGKYPPASEMNSLVVRELEALTELLAHYPKEDETPKCFLPEGCWVNCKGDCALGRLPTPVYQSYHCACPYCNPGVGGPTANTAAYQSSHVGRNGCNSSCSPNCAGE